jgi:hypothetical protein
MAWSPQISRKLYLVYEKVSHNFTKEIMSLITRLEDGSLFFECPNCSGSILVAPNEVNCKIFRHAYFQDSYTLYDPLTQTLLPNVKLIEFEQEISGSQGLNIGAHVIHKSTNVRFIIRHIQPGQQLQPHASELECQRSIEAGGLGCGKPFRLSTDAAGDTKAVTCDYI